VTTLAILLIGFVAAFLVGVSSIGGVLVLPALVFMLGVPTHDAIPATMLSFIVPSLIALVIVHRRGALDLRVSATLWSGAIPGAFVGGLVLPWVPVRLLLWAIVVILLASAIRVLGGGATQRTGGTLSPLGFAVSGLAVGLVSALTGTGGPITLMPILGWRGVEPRRAVMLCQSITLPIVIFASAGYAWSLRLDWRLIGLLAFASTIGILVGLAVAKRMPVAHVARVIGALMAVTAVIVGARLLTS